MPIKLDERWLTEPERVLIERANEPRPATSVMRAAIEHLANQLIDSRRALRVHEFGGEGQWSTGACRMPECESDHPRSTHSPKCIFHGMPSPVTKL